MARNTSPAKHPLVSWLILCALALTQTACTTLSTRDRTMLKEREVPPALSAKMEQHAPLTLAEIVELSRRKLPPAFITHYLENTFEVYSLKTDDVLALRRADVSPEVIDYLLTTPVQFARPSVNPYWPYYDPYWRSPIYQRVIVVRKHRH